VCACACVLGEKCESERAESQLGAEQKQQLLLLRVSGGVNDTCNMGKVLRINNPVKREIRLVKKKLSF